MLKRFVLIVLLFFSIHQFYAQEYIASSETTYFQPMNSTNIQLTNDFQKHWSFGGNLGFSFWNNGTSILLGPKAYYNFSPKFLTGVGLSYMYSEYKSDFNGYHSNSFGGSIMAAVRPIHFAQISVEYEGLQTNYSGYYTDSYFINALYLGLSFITGPVSIGVRYDVLYDVNKSLYSSAWNPFVGFYF